MPTRQGSIRLFQLFGITVYLHWAWFLAVAYFVHQARGYSSLLWSVAECLSLFLIVLIHEFGHQLACRSVGGKTHDIVLWVLGGVAYVSPPQRPGATLWSIAAGPLVNVVLFPVFGVFLLLAKSAGWEDANPNVFNYVLMLFYINVALLVFNLLPIYPLDGRQILRSLLWFVFGRAKSLMIASLIGFIGVAALIGLAVLQQNLKLGGICLLIVMNCWGGLMQARAMVKIANAPRHDGLACPACKLAPPRGAFWGCGHCGKHFDTFETRGVCPNCGTQFAVAFCPECGSLRLMGEWLAASNIPPKL
jgi:Zn-dependent protease/DNA-directed RNA polymerase subunit RPC12/RpoP